ncbi:MAG: hypothetical protein J0M02_00605 [Planctomycetes bacterium]|nr:hypothetical protein [Planctomycetota bacterium]
MTTIIPIAASLLLALVATQGWTGENAPTLPPAVEKAYNTYTAALAKAYQTETDKVRTALKREMDALTKKSDLDGAMAVKALLAKIDDGAGFDDVKASLKRSMLDDMKPEESTVKGWANVVITTSEPRITIAPLRVGVAAVLNTNYVFSAFNLSIPKGSELQTMQIPQFYPGPTRITAVAGGRIYLTSSTPMDVLLAQVPKEFKPGVANGSISAPSITSIVSATMPVGATMVLRGSETRVIAGSMRIVPGSVDD